MLCGSMWKRPGWPVWRMAICGPRDVFASVRIGGRCQAMAHTTRVWSCGGTTPALSTPPAADLLAPNIPVQLALKCRSTLPLALASTAVTFQARSATPACTVRCPRGRSATEAPGPRPSATAVAGAASCSASARSSGSLRQNERRGRAGDLRARASGTPRPCPRAMRTRARRRSRPSRL